jgi:hypothetical protein
VDFDEIVRKIEALSGEFVQVEIRGPGKETRMVADFSGELKRMGSPEYSEDIAEAIRGFETAVTFIVGDATFGLWPSRFVGGNHVRYRRDG